MFSTDKYHLLSYFFRQPSGVHRDNTLPLLELIGFVFIVAPCVANRVTKLTDPAFEGETSTKTLAKVN